LPFISRIIAERVRPNSFRLAHRIGSVSDVIRVKGVDSGQQKIRVNKYKKKRRKNNPKSNKPI
jgi:hypothetical protein